MITCLYPPAASQPLKGTYLSLHLRGWDRPDGGPLLFSNFVSSLDGRIALWNDDLNDYTIPASIANARDWRLYQELAAQSDVLITSARYYRQWANGRHQDVLPVGNSPDFADIHRWRKEHGLKIQPDVIIVSRTLLLPMQPLLTLISNGRSVHVVCCETSPKESIMVLQDHGINVVCCGESNVEGMALRDFIQANNYNVGCMLAGSSVHTTLLQANVLQYVFLTLRHSLVGGENFQSITRSLWSKAVHLQLKHLFYDETTEQLLGCFRVPSD